jgi:hypothetical protein
MLASSSPSVRDVSEAAFICSALAAKGRDRILTTLEGDMSIATFVMTGESDKKGGWVLNPCCDENRRYQGIARKHRYEGDGDNIPHRTERTERHRSTMNTLGLNREKRGCELVRHVKGNEWKLSSDWSTETWFIKP